MNAQFPAFAKQDIINLWVLLAGLELWNILSCLCFLRVGMTNVHHHTQLGLINLFHLFIAFRRNSRSRISPEPEGNETK
jgi:hypothetical protein